MADRRSLVFGGAAVLLVGGILIAASQGAQAQEPAPEEPLDEDFLDQELARAPRLAPVRARGRVFTPGLHLRVA